MKNYQFNFIYGTLLAILCQVSENDWASAFIGIMSIVYVVAGCIQQIQDQ